MFNNLDSEMTTRSPLLTLQQRLFEARSQTRLTTQAILEIAQNQGSLMKKNELSWTRELIKFLPVVKHTFCTVDFLKAVKNQKRRSHKRQAKFYLDLFEYLGCNYSKWE